MKRVRKSSGPGRSRRPGDRGTPRSVSSDVSPPSSDETKRPRSKLTGRAAILALVLAVLAISYASSMRAYLQQRAHISDLEAQIATKQTSIDKLARETQRWKDPAYVKDQARTRFGYVEPGERAWVVVGADGTRLEDQAKLSDPSDVVPQTPTAWWEKAWGSVELAGHPPADQDPPATRIGGPAKKISESQ